MYLPTDSVRTDSLSFLTAASDSKGCTVEVSLTFSHKKKMLDVKLFCHNG